MKDRRHTDRDEAASEFDLMADCYRTDREAREAQVREANRLIASSRPTEIFRACELLEQAFTNNNGKFDSLPEKSLVEFSAILGRLNSADRETRLRILKFLNALPPPDKLATIAALGHLFPLNDNETFARILDILTAIGPDVAALLGREIVETTVSLNNADSWRSTCWLITDFAKVDLKPLIATVFSALGKSKSSQVQKEIANHFVVRLPMICPEVSVLDELNSQLGKKQTDDLLRLLGEVGRQIRERETATGRIDAVPPRQAAAAEIEEPLYRIVGHSLVYQETQYDVGPLLAGWLAALLQGKKDDRLVRGGDLEEYEGQKLKRELDKLNAICPGVRAMIKAKRGKNGGYYLVRPQQTID